MLSKWWQVMSTLLLGLSDKIWSSFCNTNLCDLENYVISLYIILYFINLILFFDLVWFDSYNRYQIQKHLLFIVYNAILRIMSFFIKKRKKAIFKLLYLKNKKFYQNETKYILKLIFLRKFIKNYWQRYIIKKPQNWYFCSLWRHFSLKCYVIVNFEIQRCSANTKIYRKWLLILVKNYVGHCYFLWYIRNIYFLLK